MWPSAFIQSDGAEMQMFKQNRCVLLFFQIKGKFFKYVQRLKQWVL